MTATAVDFSWQVPSQGFGIVKGIKEKWLQPRGKGRSICWPLDEHPDLFRVFAAIDHKDDDQLVAFADEVGALGIRRRTQDGPDGLDAEAESISDWADEILYMRQAVRLRDLVQARDRKSLRRMVSLDRRGLKYTAKGRIARLFVATEHPKHDFKDKEDPIHAAGLVLERLVSERLSAVSMRVSYVPQPTTAEAALGMYLVAAWRHIIQPAPTNLLAALWYQFAVAVTGSKESRNCKECGEPFEIDRDDARQAKKVFCSAGCKVEEFRTRKAKAIALHEEGKSAKQIAKATDTPEATVKKWVGK